MSIGALVYTAGALDPSGVQKDTQSELLCQTQIPLAPACAHACVCPALCVNPPPPRLC